jgi:hypothetical protein
MRTSHLVAISLLFACNGGKLDVSPEGSGPGECLDGIDNDGDGLIDCDDPTSCQDALACSGEGDTDTDTDSDTDTDITDTDTDTVDTDTDWFTTDTDTSFWDTDSDWDIWGTGWDTDIWGTGWLNFDSGDDDTSWSPDSDSDWVDSDSDWWVGVDSWTWDTSSWGDSALTPHDTADTEVPDTSSAADSGVTLLHSGLDTADTADSSTP